MIEGHMHITPGSSLWGYDYWSHQIGWGQPEQSNPNDFLTGHYLTYPLDRHREIYQIPHNSNDDWFELPILVDDNLNVYYKGQKVINLKQISRYYMAFVIDCDECRCKGLYHRENCDCSCIDSEPDDQAKHTFFFYARHGLYFADSCDYEVFKHDYYRQSRVYPGKFQLGNMDISDCHVRIFIPYNSIKLPFISNTEFITKNIDYLMLPIYRRQLYTTILCFKQYGNLPYPFLTELLKYLKTGK